MPPQDLPTLPFDKHGYWFVTADSITYQPKRDKGGQRTSFSPTKPGFSAASPRGASVARTSRPPKVKT